MKKRGDYSTCLKTHDGNTLFHSNLKFPGKAVRSRLRRFEETIRMQFSIIVPVFNEAPLVRPFLQHLRKRAPEAEIIVADGGSSDGTPDLAADLCNQIVVSERNRAAQMNLGARAATGD